MTWMRGLMPPEQMWWCLKAGRSGWQPTGLCNLQGDLNSLGDSRKEASEIQQTLNFFDKKENAEGQKQFFITPLAAYWTQQKLQLLKTNFQNKIRATLQFKIDFSVFGGMRKPHTQINQSNTQFQGGNFMKRKQLSESKQKGTAKKVKTLLHDRMTIKRYCEAHGKCIKNFKTIFKEKEKKKCWF